MQLPARIRVNLGLKIVSFVLATFLWVAIKFEIRLLQSPSGGERVQEFPAMKIRILTDPQDPRSFQVTPAEVTLTVRGEALILRRLREKDFQVFVNVTESTDRLQDFIRKVDVLKPLGVSLVKVDPPMVQVEAVRPPAESGDLGK
jgi:YbbR domain-containing protein